MTTAKKVLQVKRGKSTTRVGLSNKSRQTRAAATAKRTKSTPLTARAGKSVGSKLTRPTTKADSGGAGTSAPDRDENKNAGGSHTPVDISVRKFDTKVLESTAKYFYADDPFKTHFMNALSILFPEGERFFIRSVLAYRDKVSDPKLLQEIKSFCAQEAQHTLVHEAMNELAARHGYPVEKLESMLRGELRGFTELGKKSELVRRAALATTVCMEHFTAIIAYQKLTNGTEVEDGLDPAVSALFDWHAIEETEHKGVAFDVYEATGGGPLLLRTAMLWSTLMFLGGLHINLATLLIKDGSIKSWSTWRTAGKFLLDPSTGFLVRPFGDWLAFFKPGFHPWKQHEGLDIPAHIATIAPYVPAKKSQPKRR
jgi:uncharacterized protein